VHSVAAHEQDFAEFAILNALVEFLERALVAGHEAYANLQVRPGGILGEEQHFLTGGAVDGDGFFHENVEFFLNGVAEMHPSERGGRGENHDIAGLEAIHRLLVGIEADEFSVGGDIHELGVVFDDVVVASLQAIFEDIGHGDELDRATGGSEGIDGGTAPPPAASDKGDLDHIAALRMNICEPERREGRSGDDTAGGFDELASGRGFVIAHGSVLYYIQPWGDWGGLARGCPGWLRWDSTGMLALTCFRTLSFYNVGCR
jgi:hypothetical protein